MPSVETAFTCTFSSTGITYATVLAVREVWRSLKICSRAGKCVRCAVEARSAPVKMSARPACALPGSHRLLDAALPSSAENGSAAELGCAELVSALPPALCGFQEGHPHRGILTHSSRRWAICSWLSQTVVKLHKAASILQGDAEALGHSLALLNREWQRSRAGISGRGISTAAALRGLQGGHPHRDADHQAEDGRSASPAWQSSADIL